MYFRFHFFKIVFVINGNLKYLRRVKGKRKYCEVASGDEGTCLTMWRRDDLSLRESTTSEPYWVDASLRELAWLNRPSWNWVGVVLSALTRRVPGEGGKTQLRSCRSKEVIDLEHKQGTLPEVHSSSLCLVHWSTQLQIQ